MQNCTLTLEQQGKSISKVLESYSQLARQYPQSKFAETIARSKDNFVKQLDKLAQQEYTKIEAQLPSYISIASSSASSLKKYYDILIGFPEVLRQSTKTGIKVQKKIEELQRKINQHVNNAYQLLRKNYHSKNERRYRETLVDCDKIINYALPPYLADVKKFKAKIAEDYNLHLRYLQRQYGQKLRHAFHSAILLQNYAVAESLCHNYRQQLKFYGLWPEIDVMLDDLRYLRHLSKRLQTYCPQPNNDPQLFCATLDKIIASTKLSEQSQKIWAYMVLCLQYHIWKSAAKMAAKLPMGPDVQTITKSSDWLAIQQSYTNAKGREFYLEYIQAYNHYQQATKLSRQKQYNQARMLIQSASANKIFLQQNSTKIARLAKVANSEFLRQNAIELYFSGRFLQIPKAENNYSFSIRYSLKSQKEWDDFEISKYRCRHEQQHVDITASIGLFEAYWKGKISGAMEMKVTIELPAKSPFSYNLGFSLYQQRQLHPVQYMNRYLCLMYFNAARLCYSEIHSKCPSHKDILQKLEQKIPFYGVDTAVICQLPPKPAALPPNFIAHESKMIKAKETIPIRTVSTITVSCSSEKEISFRIGKKNSTVLQSHGKLSSGYVGLYTTSDAIFSDLSISGRLAREAIAKITSIVTKNPQKFLSRPLRRSK